MTTAVLDVGKTNLKLVLFDGLDVTHVDKRENGPIERDGMTQLDVEGAWRWFVEALARAPGKERITRIAPVAHGAAGVLVDAGGEPLCALDYEWSGCEEDEAAYLAACDPFEHAATPLFPGGLNLGRQLFWLERKRPDLWGRARHVLTYPQYWAFRASGVAATEVTSLGAHSHLWRPEERRWGRLPVERDWLGLFPPLRRAWESLGPIRKELAAAAGLAPTTETLVGLHDSNASFLVYLAGRKPPFTVISTGTWAISMSLGGQNPLDPRRDMIFNVAATGAPLATLRFMGGRERDVIAGAAGASSLAAIEAILERGVLPLPSFHRGCGPFPERVGGYLDATPRDDAERSAAAALYLALMCDLSLDLLGHRGEVIVDGPFARDPGLIDALTALRPDDPIMKASHASGPALGAALLPDWPDVEPPAPNPVAAKRSPKTAEARDRWRRIVRDDAARGHRSVSPIDVGRR